MAGLAMYSQSTIWQPYNANVDTSWGQRYISAVDSNTVWAVSFNGTHSTAATRAFTKTSNGSTFTPGYFLPDTSAFTASSICAVSGSTCYIPCYFKAGTGRSGVIRKTTNGGTTWTTISDTVTMFAGAANFPDWLYAYKTNNTVVALGDPNGGYFEIWRSFNAGANWTRVPTANIPAPSGTEAGLTNSYTTYKKFMWYGTTIGRVYRSADTGQTWAVSSITGMAGGCIGLAFRDSIHGLAWGYTAQTAGVFKLVKTADGGITWTPLNLLTKVGTYDICNIPKTGGFMSVGADSVVNNYLTSVTYNDGATWTILDQGLTNPFRMISVRMLDSTHGWAGNFEDNTLPLGNYGMNKFTACAMTVTGSPAALCIGSSSTLTVGGTAAMTYTWLPSNTNVATMTVNPTVNTTYTVAGSKAGCHDTIMYTLHVAATPTLSLTSSVVNDTVCSGIYNNTTTLTVTGATNYTWTPATGLSSSSSGTVTCHPTSSTSYTVKGYNNSCVATKTISITVKSCVGIETYNQDDNAYIYPNPGSGVISIRFGKPAIGTSVTLTDMLGKQVYAAALNYGVTNHSMDLTNLPKGLYFLTISAGTSSRQIQKLIIE